MLWLTGQTIFNYLIMSFKNRHSLKLFIYFLLNVNLTPFVEVRKLDKAKNHIQSIQNVLNSNLKYDN